MKSRSVIVINEAKGNVDLYHIRVEVAGVPLWTGVYAESVERAHRIAGKLFGKSSIRGRPTKVKESKGKGPHNKVKKGSQKRYKHPIATDKPDKYIGKWEAYDEPQGVGSRAANITMKPPTNESLDTPPGEFVKINPFAIKKGAGGRIVYAAKFSVDDMDYAAWVEEDEEYPGLYSFSFDTLGKATGSTDQRFMRTGAGHPRKVFATVFPIIRDALDSKKIPAMMFSGSDPKQSILYSRIVKKHGDGGIHPGYFVPRRFKYPVSDPVIQHQVLPLRPINEEVLPDVKTYSPEEIARKHGVDLDFIMGQLRLGIKAELEHTKDKRLAKEIALDHLLELPDYYSRLEKMEEGSGSTSHGDLGPQFSRGLTNSSTGLGAAPPKTEFQPHDLPNKLRPNKKHAGSKAPTRNVVKTVSKSLTDKVRKPNSPVTETRLDELFGSGQTLPHDYNPRGYSEIEVDDETSVVVGFEDIRPYIPNAKPGLNAGFATMHQGQLMHGLDRENLNLDRRTLFALFNTVMQIVSKYVNDNDPDRVYFVAVEPMKNIYPRLIKKFVDSEKWDVSKGRAMIPMIGQELDVYMCERRRLDEMVRLPIKTKFNADYEIKDGEKTVGIAVVTDGVIEKLMINQDEADEKYKGQALSTTLGTIVRDANLQNANLAIQIANLEDQEMKRFLERFGFRHVGDGIFKRNAGAITPPSVIEYNGKETGFDFRIS